MSIEEALEAYCKASAAYKAAEKAFLLADAELRCAISQDWYDKQKEKEDENPITHV